MNRTQKAVILTRLARELRSRGSWVGETHLQKAVFLLEEVTKVELGYPFILYFYGPFSFELREEVNRLRADGLLDLVPQPYPYGPSFRPTEAAAELEGRLPKTLGTSEDAIAYVADLVGSKSAALLERLGTAAYLLRENPEAEVESLAVQFTKLKPHVSADSALLALRTMREAIQEAP